MDTCNGRSPVLMISSFTSILCVKVNTVRVSGELERTLSVFDSRDSRDKQSKIDVFLCISIQGFVLNAKDRFLPLWTGIPATDAGLRSAV